MTDGAPFERLTPEGAGVDVGLLLAPAFDRGVGEACTNLLTTSRPERTTVLFVTTRPADRCLVRYRAHAEADPAEVAIVALGRAAGSADGVDDPLVTRYEAVENPSNLTRVGIVVSDLLDALDDEDTELTVCFDSATALLQYAEERTVFRFLAELVDQFRTHDAWAHVHLDPEAHDRSTVSSLLQLFDVVVDRTSGAEADVLETAEREQYE